MEGPYWPDITQNNPMHFLCIYKCNSKLDPESTILSTFFLISKASCGQRLKIREGDVFSNLAG